MLPFLLQTFTGVRTVPDFLIQLEQFGLLDAVIPFILIFAIVFTVAKRTKVLGDNKGVQVLLALCLALLVLIPHITGTYPPGKDVVNIINSALPNMALLIVIIIAALILAGLFLPEGQLLTNGFLAFLAGGAVIYIFGLSAGWWQNVAILRWLGNPDIQAFLVIVLVFGFVIFLITAEDPWKKSGDGLKNMLRLFGGGGPHT